MRKGGVNRAAKQPYAKKGGWTGPRSDRMQKGGVNRAAKRPHAKRGM